MESVLTSQIQNEPCDWSLVVKAFPLEHIRLSGELEVRPLMASDLEALSEFLTDDPEMTWTQKPWRRENVEYLLSYRLSHYKQYGFGPYGVLLQGKLRAMAGVQVWPYENCSLEQVAYVAREEWSKGVATALLRWTIHRARDVAGVKALYAATRKDNERSIYLTEKLGFRRIGEGDHFGYPAIHWRLAFSRASKCS